MLNPEPRSCRPDRRYQRHPPQVGIIPESGYAAKDSHAYQGRCTALTGLALFSVYLLWSP
jgi:hypothetical protein